MSLENPIVGFDHVTNNDWGAGLNPIWRDGTIGTVKWTKMAELYGIKRAIIPDPTAVAKALIHYNNNTL